MNTENNRKKRININQELIRIIRAQVDAGKNNREISELNCISISCARTLSNKFSASLTDSEILKKMGRKKQTIATSIF